MSRIHARISLVSFTLAAAFAHAPAAIAGYYYSPVDPPGSIASEALGLNDSGVIVGEYSVQTGTGPSVSSFQYGFVDNQGVFTTLAPNPDSSCGGYAPMCNAAWGVNNAGDVVGTYFTDDGAAHGFLYTNGNYSTFTELNVPGAGSTQAFGISNNGLVVGQAIESSGDLSRDSLNDQRIDGSLPVQGSHGCVDCAVEGVGISEGLMGQMARLEIVPDNLDVVEFGCVFWQPLDGEPVFARLDGFKSELADMDRPVVLDQYDRFYCPSWLRTEQVVELLEVSDEVAAALGLARMHNQLARDMIE